MAMVSGAPDRKRKARDIMDRFARPNETPVEHGRRLSAENQAKNGAANRQGGTPRSPVIPRGSAMRMPERPPESGGDYNTLHGSVENSARKVDNLQQGIQRVAQARVGATTPRGGDVRKLARPSGGGGMTGGTTAASIRQRWRSFPRSAATIMGRRR